MANNKLMIVDDDKEFLEELETALGLSGYDLVVFSDALAALERVSEIKPQAVLLDLRMPSMSGFQLADEIRHRSELTNVPIIAMTAQYKDEYKALMKLCGIEKCLRKPFTPQQVIAEIESSWKQR